MVLAQYTKSNRKPLPIQTDSIACSEFALRVSSDPLVDIRTHYKSL